MFHELYQMCQATSRGQTPTALTRVSRVIFFVYTVRWINLCNKFQSVGIRAIRGKRRLSWKLNKNHCTTCPVIRDFHAACSNKNKEKPVSNGFGGETLNEKINYLLLYCTSSNVSQVVSEVSGHFEWPDTYSLNSCLTSYLFCLYCTLDKFVQQISIRGNPCNPWQKAFELEAQ